MLIQKFTDLFSMFFKFLFLLCRHEITVNYQFPNFDNYQNAPPTQTPASEIMVKTHLTSYGSSRNNWTINA